ncbi:39S ribosomal protein L35, mitochondrial [Nylanderia fulva]|uniref:39S ribosomal protein L35, mitochondrial n=1 Tax=Nylanderia fulva TaxID=613905 RepID=UPI0010FB0E11|nr:39S ribosomal protein L35, mitochondrial [Nylanderia fulva]
MELREPKRRMLRVVSATLRGIAARATNINVTSSVASKCNLIFNSTQQRNFGALSIAVQNWTTTNPVQHKSLLNNAITENRLALPTDPINVPVRTLIKFSMKKGKRKTVKTVLKRFYRLHWGIWIRTRTGRKKHLWRKTYDRRKRLQQHVFCNATQCTMLDKMVTKYWRRRHYYVDDPYEPYHNREEFIFTRKRPLP